MVLNVTGPLYVYLFLKVISFISRCTFCPESSCLCWRWYTASSLKPSQADWEMCSDPGTCKRAVDEADKGLDCLAVIRTRWARGPHTSPLSSVSAAAVSWERAGSQLDDLWPALRRGEPCSWRWEQGIWSNHSLYRSLLLLVFSPERDKRLFERLERKRTGQRRSYLRNETRVFQIQEWKINYLEGVVHPKNKMC